MAVTVTASAAKAPPVKTPRAAKTTPPSADVTATREKALTEIASIPIAVCIAMGNLADAGTIEIYWPMFSRELAKLAESQEGIGKWIDPLTRIGPYTGILTVAAPMAMQFAVNHGRGTVGAMGTVSPQVLAAQIELRIAKLEAEALRQQLEAEQQARETRAEIEKARAEMNGAA
jgi:hypothetical protein